jgi:hypothetical protein
VVNVTKTLGAVAGLVIGHIKNGWDWSQSDTNDSRFVSTLESSLAAAILIGRLQMARDRPQVAAIGFSVGIFVPIALGIGSFALYMCKVDETHSAYETVRLLYQFWDRMAQVVNIICLVAFFRFGSRFFGLGGVTLGLQLIDFFLSLGRTAKQRTMREATEFVRHDNKRQPYKPVKPYYHLLAIANKYVKDVDGSEFRSHLLSMIREADDEKHPDRANQLTTLAFALEAESDGKVKREKLQKLVYDYSMQ